MRQEETGQPPGCRIALNPVEYWIKHRVKEERKGADHDHDFKGHDEENDDAPLRCHVLESFKKAPASHEFSYLKVRITTLSIKQKPDILYDPDHTVCLFRE
jgi:hypothetical protein